MADFELPEFPPELALAVTCARWPLDETGRREVGQRASGALDWSRFLAWIGRHRIAPLVHHNLQPVVSGIPDTVLAQLKEQQARNAHQVLVQISEATRIKRALDDAGIRSMMIKGPVLSVLAFGDPTLRESRDVDLYVDQGRVGDADRLIAEAGYRRFAPALELSPRQNDTYLRRRCQFAYHSAQTGVIQELHWRLTSNSALLTIDEPALWRRSDPVRLSGVDFITLPDEEMFLYLCVHGSVHVWFRLKWLIDIAALLQRMDSGYLEGVSTRARLLGIQRPFHQALLLAHCLLRAPVPPRLLEEAAQDRTARRAALAAHRALCWNRSPSEPAETRWFNAWVGLQAYRLKPSFAYRWAEFQDQMCSPEDWMRLPLPERLFFLYVPLRPVSWAFRKIAAARSSERLARN